MFFNRMINFSRILASTPAMMNALERTAVSVTIDGRTERGHQKLLRGPTYGSISRTSQTTPK